MKPWRWALIAALGVWGWVASAQANPWLDLNAFRFQGQVLTTATDGTAPPPEPPHITGQIVRFESAFDLHQIPFCQITIASEGKGTIARFSPPYNVFDNAYIPLAIFNNVCLAAQRAYLHDQSVAVFGDMISPGNPQSNSLGIMSVATFAPFIPGQAALTTNSAGFPEPANICQDTTTCRAAGNVVGLQFDAIHFNNVCTVQMHIPQTPDGVKSARLVVSLPKMLELPQAHLFEALQLIQGRLHACQTFHEAMGEVKPVIATGTGDKNGDQMTVSYVKMEDAPPPGPVLIPLF